MNEVLKNPKKTAWLWQRLGLGVLTASPHFILRGIAVGVGGEVFSAFIPNVIFLAIPKVMLVFLERYFHHSMTCKKGKKGK